VRKVFASLLVSLWVLSPACFAANVPALDQPMMLVAQPSLGEFYKETVLFVRQLPNGGHVGFIVNRPTPVTLGKLFEDHAPSQKVTRPIMLGGPVNTDAVMALVNRNAGEEAGLMQLAEGLSVAFSADAVDRIIEADGDKARFVVGLVVWQPNELATEIQKGFWFVRPYDATLIFGSDPNKIWDEQIEKLRFENPGTGNPKTGIST
jgi:putative transcriptional regulator